MRLSVLVLASVAAIAMPVPKPSAVNLIGQQQRALDRKLEAQIAELQAVEAKRNLQPTKGEAGSLDPDRKTIEALRHSIQDTLVRMRNLRAPSDI